MRVPDEHGHFGVYGGRFVAETLIEPLEELTRAYEKYIHDEEFLAEFDRDLKTFVGRPSPLYHAHRWSGKLAGAQIYLKREDLNHTGAHKVNNTVGQALLAKRMGKTRIIAETGAGQHGVAAATVAARMGLECVVYMGAEDIRRQAVNVYRMKLLGAEVVEVSSGSQTLKDAMNEAMRDWVSNVDDTFYIIGTSGGAASLSGIGQGPAIYHRQGSQGTMSRNDGQTARYPHCLCRWRLQCDRVILSVSARYIGQVNRRGSRWSGPAY